MIVNFEKNTYLNVNFETYSDRLENKERSFYMRIVDTNSIINEVS